MHIILTILAVIGKVLLFLLLFVLALLIILLLVPVRYELQAEKHHAQELKGRIGVSWLLRFIQLYGSISQDRSLLVCLKVCGFTLKRIEKGGTGGHSPGSDPEEADAALSEYEGSDTSDTAASGHEGTDTSETEYVSSGEGADTAAFPDPDAGSEAAPSVQAGPGRAEAASGDPHSTRKTQASVSLAERISALLQKLVEKLGDAMTALWDGMYRAEDTLSKGAEKVGQLERTCDKWVTGPHKAAVRHIFGRLRILLRHYAPRIVKGFLHFGTGMPDITGYLTGLISVILPAGADAYEVTPEFHERMLDTDTTIRGHIRLIHVFIAAAALLLDKNFRKLLRSMLRARKGGKNG